MRNLEAADARGSGGKLAAGARLNLFYPEWDRPCARCIEWRYEKDGTVARMWNGEPAPRGNAPTPCGSCAKPPTWAKAAGKSEPELRKLAFDFAPENRKALARFKEFRATHNFPVDPLVTWYSGILGDIFEERERAPLERLELTAQLLVPYLLMLAKRRT